MFGLPVGCSGNTTSKWCFVLLFLSLFDPCFISNPLSVILVISIFLVFAFSHFEGFAAGTSVVLPCFCACVQVVRYVLRSTSMFYFYYYRYR